MSVASRRNETNQPGSPTSKIVPGDRTSPKHRKGASSTEYLPKCPARNRYFRREVLLFQEKGRIREPKWEFRQRRTKRSPREREREIKRTQKGVKLKGVFRVQGTRCRVKVYPFQGTCIRLALTWTTRQDRPDPILYNTTHLTNDYYKFKLRRERNMDRPVSRAFVTSRRSVVASRIRTEFRWWTCIRH